MIGYSGGECKPQWRDLLLWLGLSIFGMVYSVRFGRAKCNMEKRNFYGCPISLFTKYAKKT